MSVISDAASVSIELADYAALDSSKKINIIGAGLDMVGFNAAAGLTASFALVVSVGVGPEHYGEECSLEVTLEDLAGQPVKLPGLAPGSDPQLMRVGQVVTFDEPRMPNLPRKVLWARTRTVLGFATGLPLAIGQAYDWRVRIDGATTDQWVYRFFVPGAPTPIVVG